MVLTLVSCSRIKGLFDRGRDEGELSLGDVEELRLSYIQQDIDALRELIAIYEDENQPLDVRIAAVRAIGESRHPLALQSLAEYVEEAEALELDLILISIDVLGGFQDDPRASEALVQSIFTVDQKVRELQQAIFNSLKTVKPEDRVLILLDIYERSRAAFQNTALMISKTLGNMDRDEVIPILVFLANDESLDIKVRNRALDILAQKRDSPEVIEMFADMLTDPTLEAQVRDFALRTMKDVKQERLILALLETYNRGQESYFSLLNTLLDALANFDDPAVKPTLIEMAISPGIPRDLRMKALKNLAVFKDPSVFDSIVPMLEDPDNYPFYTHIIELAQRLGVTDQYKNQLRAAALVAQEKAVQERKLQQ